MPYHNRKNPRDALESLHQNQQRISDAVDRMKNRTTNTVQINNIADTASPDVQDPVEGEIRIDYSDQQIAWRVNDAWHKPGGTPKWAALYSGAFVWGQPITGTGVTQEVHYPAYDQSDNSTAYFTFDQYSDPDLVMPQIYRVTIHQSGIYTFHLNVYWLNVDDGEIWSMYGVGRNAGGGFLTPGQISQPASNITLFAEHYRSLWNFGSWDFVEQNSWTTPIIINSPVQIYSGVGFKARDAGGNPVTGGASIDSRLLITWHGPIEHATTSFNAQDA